MDSPDVGPDSLRAPNCESVGRDLIAQIDATIRADILQYEDVATQVFQPVYELIRATDGVAPEELEAVISSAYTGVRLEVRRFVWASAANNLDTLGARLTLENCKALYKLRRTEARAWSVKQRYPWFPRLWWGRHRIKLLSIPDGDHPMHDVVLRYNTALTKAKQGLLEGDAYVRKAASAQGAEARAYFRKVIVRNVTLMMNFALIQIGVFGAASAVIGSATNLAFSSFPSWGSFAAAIASGALATFLVRPFLRTRFQTKLNSASKSLFMQWVVMQSCICINRVAQWQRGIGATVQE